jgi:pyruvate formate lyase activating enzyme
VTKGLIFDIRRFSVHDGPGIRTTIFFKGCPLSCWWCHNPESRSKEPEISIKSIKLDGRIYRRKETTGKEMTIREVIGEIEKDRIFFDESKGGVTLSGGEPMFQSEFLYELLKELKQQGYHVALDTCGYAEQMEFEKILPYVDLFLFDIKLIDDTEHIQYTGVSNQQILKNLHFLFGNQKNVILRFPVIPGITDCTENITAIKSYLKNSPNHQITKSPIEIHLLPYHSIAKKKYQRFLFENKLANIKDMRKEDLIQLKREFEESGFSVKIGG